MHFCSRIYLLYSTINLEVLYLLLAFPSTTAKQCSVNTRKAVESSIKVGTKRDSLEGEAGYMQVGYMQVPHK